MYPTGASVIHVQVIPAQSSILQPGMSMVSRHRQPRTCNLAVPTLVGLDYSTTVSPSIFYRTRRVVFDAPEVRSNNLGTRIHVRSINRPNTGSSADVENPLRILEWREMELSLHHLQQDFVVHVEACVQSISAERFETARCSVLSPVLLGLIRGHEVLVGSEIGMVAATWWETST